MSDLIAFKYTVGDMEGRKRAERCADIVLEDRAWTKHIQLRGLILLSRSSANDAPPLLLPRDGGAVIGILFERTPEGHRRVQAVAEAAAKLWFASAGGALIENYWGPYLAVLLDLERDRVLIVRDPMGARPAYLATLPGVRVVFTDLDAWSKLAAPEIDPEYLRLFLSHPRLSSPRTGLKGVAEVKPGVAHIWQRTASEEATLWLPAPTADQQRHTRFESAAQTVRKAALACGAAWANAGLPIVHRLSGGFDSSAALASLVVGGARDIVAINERAPDLPEADEFEAAATAAKHFSVPLVEVCCAASAVDYEKLAQARPAPRPSLADLSFADPSAQAVLARAEAFLITSGQGGDQVFSRRPLLNAAADALRDGRKLGEIAQILMNGARLSGKSLQFMARELIVGLTRSQQSALGAAMGAGAGDAAKQEAIEEALSHPWVRDVDHRGPARALRAMNLIDLNFYQRPTALSAHAIAAPIFASQPLVETVLAIPPYLMQWGGRDRALARAAFADLLPEATLARATKGDTTRHFVRTMVDNAPYLDALLREGELMRMGLIDKTMLAGDLARPEGPALFRLLTALVAEHWIGRIKALPAPVLCSLGGAPASG